MHKSDDKENASLKDPSLRFLLFPEVLLDPSQGLRSAEGSRVQENPAWGLFEKNLANVCNLRIYKNIL